MKRIIITHINGNDKSSILSANRAHNVSMGNGITLRFRNELLARTFLQKASEELSFQLIVMNDIYVDLFTEFRKNWFYFNLTQELLRDQQTIKNAFNLFDRQTDLAVSRCEFANGNEFVFRYLYQSCEALFEVVDILVKFHKYKRNYANAKMMNVHKHRLETCHLTIDNIGLSPIPDGCKKMEDRKKSDKLTYSEMLALKVEVN